MSGVFGIFDAQARTPVQALAERAGKEMTHHSWQRVETWVDAPHGIALGRLSIGVFNEENQPLFSQDGKVAVVLAGELHNAAELRRELECRERPCSDLEIVLHLYRRHGDAFIAELEGAFILAIWDAHLQRLTLANDRFGLYPTYYSHVDGRFQFAPEMKALLVDAGFKKELNWNALAEYMRFQSLLGDKTFFENVKLLPNATLACYSLRDDRLEIRSYWDFSHLPQLPAGITFQEALEESARLFRAAVERQSEGSYRLGVLLSGGLDSRAILGMLPKERRPVDTFTYGLPDSVDVAFAARLARVAGARHHTYTWTSGEWVKKYAPLHLELTEGFHSWIHAHGISCLEQIREIIDLNLTGLGGDYTALSWNDPALLQAQDAVSFVQGMFMHLNQHATWPSIDEGEEMMLYAPRMRGKLAGRAFESLRQELAAFEHIPYASRAEYFALVNVDRRMYQYYTVFKRAAIELRFPFYDYRYNEFMYALPPQLRAERKLRKAMIVREMPALAKVLNAADRDPLSDNRALYWLERFNAWGQRTINSRLGPVFPEYNGMYANYEAWLRAELHDWGESILLGEKILQRELFNPDYLRSIWARCNSGLEVNIIGKLAPIMTYEMMLERFYDDP